MQNGYGAGKQSRPWVMKLLPGVCRRVVVVVFVNVVDCVVYAVQRGDYRIMLYCIKRLCLYCQLMTANCALLCLFRERKVLTAVKLSI